MDSSFSLSLSLLSLCLFLPLSISTGSATDSVTRHATPGTVHLAWEFNTSIGVRSSFSQGRASSVVKSTYASLTSEQLSPRSPRPSSSSLSSVSRSFHSPPQRHIPQYLDVPQYLDALVLDHNVCHGASCFITTLCTVVDISQPPYRFNLRVSYARGVLSSASKRCCRAYGELLCRTSGAVPRDANRVKVM